MREAAREWYNSGFNVVAMRITQKEGKAEKKPLVKWSEWMIRRQTEEEFENQPWDKANGFAVVLDWPNERGLYLAVIDYDVVKVSDEAKESGWKALSLLPKTRVEETPSGGFHFLFLSKIKPNTVSETHRTHALELLGSGHIAIVCPSDGYNIVKGDPIWEMEDIEGYFYEMVKIEDKRIPKGRKNGKKALESQLDEIRSLLDVKYESKRWIIALCPFHEESRPSFAVNKEKYYAIDFHPNAEKKVYKLGELIKILKKKEEEEEEETVQEEEIDELEGVPEEEIEYAKRPMTVEELIDVLGVTIKRDNINKLIHFLAGILTYTDDSQVTVNNRGPSSTGKSYLPIEITSLYFPKNDIIMLAYVSPTAFFHDVGVWDDQEKCYRVILERKIIVFLDQPHDELLQRLRPLLSHDQKELLLKITDRKEKKGLRTKNVKIIGFPTVFFCSGSLRMDEQEATRSFVLSPEISEEKIREGIFLKALRKGNPDEFKKLIDSDPRITALRRRVLLIKKAGIKKIIIRNPEKIAERFMNQFPNLKPRHMRDSERIIGLAKGLALLNLWYREVDGDTLYVSDEDIEKAFEIYSKIALPQELGIPPYLYDIYTNVILEIAKEKGNGYERVGVTKEEILKGFYRVYTRAMSPYFLTKEVLPALESAGLIEKGVDPEDKRRALYFPLFIPQEDYKLFNANPEINAKRVWGTPGEKTGEIENSNQISQENQNKIENGLPDSGGPLDLNWDSQNYEISRGSSGESGGAYVVSQNSIVPSPESPNYGGGRGSDDLRKTDSLVSPLGGHFNEKPGELSTKVMACWECVESLKDRLKSPSPKSRGEGICEVCGKKGEVFEITILMGSKHELIDSKNIPDGFKKLTNLKNEPNEPVKSIDVPDWVSKRAFIYYDKNEGVWVFRCLEKIGEGSECGLEFLSLESVKKHLISFHHINPED